MCVSVWLQQDKNKELDLVAAVCFLLQNLKKQNTQQNTRQDTEMEQPTRRRMLNEWQEWSMN